jgi:outer membrane receptor protein involved in Fe transport
MNARRVLLVLLGLVVFITPWAAFPQVTTTGKISGKVVDKESGEPLIGATVVVVEQPRLGAGTDINGEYFILNVPVGTFTLKASFIGYREVVVKNVRVNAGYTSEQKISMSAGEVEVGEVVIEATRPLIKKDQTNATSITSAEEIKNLPLRGFEGVVSVQSGVVSGRGTDNNTFYTRGGRANETVIFVDGFEQNNLLTGAATVSVNGNAIEEVQMQTGGYNAEYGRALSGVINVVTKEASSRYTAQIEAESDFFMGDKNSRGYGLYNFSVSGPVIPDEDLITLFISGELKNLSTSRATQGTVGQIYRQGKMQDWDKGYLPDDRNDGYTLQSKLRFRFTPTSKLSLNLLFSNSSSQTYFDIYKYNLDHTPYNHDINGTVSATYTINWNKSTFMEVSGAYFNTYHFSGDAMFRDDFSYYPKTNPNNPRNLYDPERGGYFFPDGWEQFQGSLTDTTGMGAYLADNGLTRYLTTDRYDPYGLYFAPGYVRPLYQKYEASYINPKINLVSQIDEHNELKLGAEYRYHTLRFYENREANRGVDANLINAFGYGAASAEVDDGMGGLLDKVKHPYDIALFAQDKLDIEGLVVNAGIRFDFFNANTKALKDERDPLGANQVPSGDPRARLADESDFSETKTESQISPRIGVGFPITDRTVFFFNYGKFFQQSNLTDLYYGTQLIEFKALNGSPAIWTQNPNLKPEETTSYEIGVNHQLAENLRFTASAYYKDTKNLVNIVYTPTTAPGGAALYLYSNQDYGTIKGVDLGLEARRVGIFSGRVAYSIAFAEGTGSANRENFNAAWLGFQTAKFTQPLAFDQRHTLSANIDIRAQKGDVNGILENAGANILVMARSGFPYTPTSRYNAPASAISIAVPKDAPLDGVNTRYGPWTFRIDLKLNKELVFGPFRTEVYLRVLNLLDTKNVLGVYQATGSADADGYLGSPLGQNDVSLYDADNKVYTTGADFTQRYNDRLAGADVNLNGNSQRKYDQPREIRLGVIIGF